MIDVEAAERVHKRLAGLVDGPNREIARGAGEACGMLAKAFRSGDWDALRVDLAELDGRPADYRGGAFATLDIFIDVIDAFQAADAAAEATRGAA
ncbi:hypothetical protein AB1484_31935 [Parafrankia sp. FMc6]|uniref:hypothetical protein n=1 Tax=Parafrankia soli TaxID=2599596 RepID=UPI0034D71A3C